ncbi:TPA: hypothetical protein ACJJD0_001589, partial [Neisseria meningitidis]
TINLIHYTVNRHSRAGGNPESGIEETFLSDEFLCGQIWIPACAGMTGFNNLPYHNTVAVDWGEPRHFAESNGFVGVAA